MNLETTIPASVVLQWVERLMKFPYPAICRHLVAADMLSALEEHGYPVSRELVKAVVDADDEAALDALTKAGVTPWR